MATLADRLKDLLRPAPPPALVRRWRPLDAAGRAAVEGALREHYFSQPINHMGLGATAYLATDEGQDDLASHLDGRLASDRREVLPWLASLVPLEGARVLEIGCGTGASTVALTEQGAQVTGADINPGNVAAARERCAAYGVSADFVVGNAAELDRWARTAAFDLVIFFATLEHLTVGERLAALRAAWGCVAPGGCLVIFEAPNRLWWYDGHTSSLPFYHWLPDELALPASRESPRPSMRLLYGDVERPTPEQLLDFARRGRGVSYHEVAIALGPDVMRAVRSDLLGWHRARTPLATLKWRRSRNGRFQALLRSFAPAVPPAYFEPVLSLALAKSATPASA